MAWPILKCKILRYNLTILNQVSITGLMFIQSYNPTIISNEKQHFFLKKCPWGRQCLLWNHLKVTHKIYYVMVFLSIYRRVRNAFTAKRTSRLYTQQSIQKKKKVPHFYEWALKREERRIQEKHKTKPISVKLKSDEMSLWCWSTRTLSRQTFRNVCVSVV